MRKKRQEGLCAALTYVCGHLGKLDIEKISITHRLWQEYQSIYFVLGRGQGKADSVQL
jgi:hypothetical protein